MKNIYFQSIEQLKSGQTLVLKDIVDELIFNHQALIPVITQDADSKEVLMMAWMNKACLEQTLVTRQMTYWSRSRDQVWVKGETSGSYQTLESMRFDCDGDAVLCLVKQTGAACHTGRQHCFYLEANPASQSVTMLSTAP
jgi:phosphoribosyl-AMP cyclohydrolase|tara:strand:- start:4276 stop:4695 length:420 start_codon:yes stop_codon:yes gene_type:complete